ncbi:MAG TPA: SUMF1/EgtB/PvdO family nonheme iron enzyme, partial [archaeon]|nr:SUMF1/EgtB/PvdO family nonheme iron enzyme [archaeon]
TKSDFIGFRVVRRGAALPVPTYNLQGSILEGGVGVPGVVVQVSGSGMDIVLASGPDGSYGFSGLAEGKYRIVFSISDSKYAPADGVELTVDRDLRVDVIQGITLVSIPAGSFLMGHLGGMNTEPVHTVTLSAFQMSAAEITHTEYEAIMDTNPNFFTWDPYLPVYSIKWFDVVRFCNRLSAMAGLDSCYNLENWQCDFRKNGFRLPTEAEWEYACRAGTTNNYYTGDSESDLDRAGWYKANSGSLYHPVGQKEPNAWGLYDMHGSVYEWCNDWWGSYRGESLTNPTGPVFSIVRILRGGCRYDDFEKCSSWWRYYYFPDWQYPDFGPNAGLRVVRRLETIPTFGLQGGILLNGSGLESVSVQLYGNGVDTTLFTGVDGSYSLTGLADGNYWIVVSKSGYSFTPEASEVTISGSDITVQDIIAEISVPIPGPLETEIIQGITLISLPGGSFQMGQEGTSSVPVHTVTLDPFWIAQTEVTQGQYRAVTGGNPSHFTGNDSLPVETVNWDDAVRFCNYLSKLAGLDTCYNTRTRECDFTKNGFRLPTEAEWEYAARAGTKFWYYTGYFEKDLARAAWYKTNSKGTTHPVAQKEPNVWGLYDMHGNVYEWCNDSWIDYTIESQTNPTGGPVTAITRIFRGGSYDSQAVASRSAARGSTHLNLGYFNTGFRVVCRK